VTTHAKVYFAGALAVAALDLLLIGLVGSHDDADDSLDPAGAPALLPYRAFCLTWSARTMMRRTPWAPAGAPALLRFWAPCPVPNRPRPQSRDAGGARQAVRVSPSRPSSVSERPSWVEPELHFAKLASRLRGRRGMSSIARPVGARRGTLTARRWRAAAAVLAHLMHELELALSFQHIRRSLVMSCAVRLQARSRCVCGGMTLADAVVGPALLAWSPTKPICGCALGTEMCACEELGNIRETGLFS